MAYYLLQRCFIILIGQEKNMVFWDGREKSQGTRNRQNQRDQIRTSAQGWKKTWIGPGIKILHY